ncbi:TIGR02234 family membrane protein, partial [Streptomyces sp. NPDC096153]
MGDVTAVPVPHSGAEPERAARAAASGRRSLAAALFLGAVGAAAVLLASGQTWAEGTAAVGAGSVPLEADGRDVSGL